MKMFRLVFVLLAGMVVSSMILINCKSKTAGDSKTDAGSSWTKPAHPGRN